MSSHIESHSAEIFMSTLSTPEVKKVPSRHKNYFMCNVHQGLTNSQGKLVL